jgi:hypothetical protein
MYDRKKHGPLPFTPFFVLTDPQALLIYSVRIRLMFSLYLFVCDPVRKISQSVTATFVYFFM